MLAETSGAHRLGWRDVLLGRFRIYLFTGISCLAASVLVAPVEGLFEAVLGFAIGLGGMMASASLQSRDVRLGDHVGDPRTSLTYDVVVSVILGVGVGVGAWFANGIDAGTLALGSLCGGALGGFLVGIPVGVWRTLQKRQAD